MVSAILLGAGESKRMGANKLFLPWGRKTVFEHCFNVLLRSKIEEVIVVLSDRTKEIRSQFEKRSSFPGKRVKVTMNPNYKRGISTSIRRGIQAIDPRSQGILIALGDQPLLKTRTVNTLIDAFCEGREGIVVPSFRGKEGHPVIFHRRYEKELLKLKGDVGGKSILRRYPRGIKVVRVKSEGVVKDMDTWQQYKNGLRKRLKEVKMKKGTRVKSERKVEELVVLIRGAGEMASGVAHRLQQSHFKICMLEIPHPIAVRRGVSFCEAIDEGEKEVEGVQAKLISTPKEIQSVWKEGKIPLLVDPDGKKTRSFLKPDVLIDAILAKKNLGTHIKEAPLVIGLGPGFTAGKDAHIVIETNRGQNLGKMILTGTVEPDTGIPGEIGGFTVERVLRTMKKGIFRPQKSIGDRVSKGSVVAVVDDFPVIAKISGVVRGLLREGVEARKGMKVGDIDPRGKRELCFTISDKARAIGGGVLEAILHWFNR